MAKAKTVKPKTVKRNGRARPPRVSVSAPEAPSRVSWRAARWLLLRLAVVYLGFNLGLNLLLSASQPLRPLRLLTLGRIDERLDSAGLLLRHYLPVHACERAYSRPELEELAAAVATYQGVEPALLQAVADTESAFVPHAISPVGAVGLAQLMPSTARWMGVDDPFNPRENLDGSARFLKSLLARYKGDLPLTLAAYNAGPGTVQRYGGVPPWPETQAYIKRVSTRLTYYRSLALAAAGPDTQ